MIVVPPPNLIDMSTEIPYYISILFPGIFLILLGLIRKIL